MSDAPQLPPIKEAIANMRRLFRQTAITAAVNVLLHKYDCFDEDDGDTPLVHVEDFQACDMTRIDCYVKGTAVFAGQICFIPNNGSSPAEDFCDWTCGNDTQAKRDFDALMEDITNAIDFEC